MIEIVSETRCTGCDRCVRICPTDVFDAVPGGAPVIARPDACQTCFMCELYCPVDALYVAPDAGTHPGITEADVDRLGLWGQYRHDSGWGPGHRTSGVTNQNWRMDDIFAEAFRLAGQGAPAPVGRPLRSRTSRGRDRRRSATSWSGSEVTPSTRRISGLWGRAVRCGRGAHR